MGGGLLMTFYAFVLVNSLFRPSACFHLGLIYILCLGLLIFLIVP